MFNDTAKYCPKRRTSLLSFNAGIGHQADSCCRILNTETQCSSHRSHILKCLPHHSHICVGTGRRLGQHVSKLCRTGGFQIKRRHSVRYDVGYLSQILRGGRQIHDSWKAGQHGIHIPASHRHVFQALPRFCRGEFCLNSHLLGQSFQTCHL